VFSVLAFDSFPNPRDAAVRAPEERLGQYALLKRLPAGLRAEVWLGLPAGAASLGQLVAIKAFFPHAPGPARAGLSSELALAARLSHANIVQTLHVGSDADRPFIVSEYLEGTTLHALLRRARVARARVPSSVVTRLLLAIVRAVSHAERRVATPVTRRLVQQVVAAEDVFVTFDGAVKLLGFKGRLDLDGRPDGVERRLERRGRAAPAKPRGASQPAAIDALLSEHLTPALNEVLAEACRPPAGDPEGRRLPGLRRVERGLERWQSDVVGSDGRAELAALMGALFPTARLELRAWLEARLEQRLSARSAAVPFTPDDAGAPPASGFRTVVA
jgi:hypothetical protein